MKSFKSIFLSIALILSCSIMSASPPQKAPLIIDTSLFVPGKKAASTVYGDTKDLIKYSGDVLEKAATRLDTILSHGARQISKGGVHAFDVLKTQQLVKSFHHLFYWILGIFLIVVFTKYLKKAISNSTDENMVAAVLFGIVAGTASVYNAMHFMEMWTGFLNPEYGVYLDILEFMNSSKGS